MSPARSRVMLHVVASSLIGLVGIIGTAHAQQPAPAADDQVIVRVGDQSISRSAYQLALHQAARRSSYHGTIAPDRLAQLQREVVNRMIDEHLLLAEAVRRGIAADPATIPAVIESFEKRNAGRPDWAERREVAINNARAGFERRERLRLLEAQVRKVGAPRDDEIDAFYRDNPDSFTEPERVRLSAILLKVDPSSPAPAWAAALEEAQRLVQRLRNGASFEDAARLQSADGSALNGGDMGYVHRGMLAESAQQVIDAAAPGQITDPVRILQGVLIMRLNERVASRLLPLDEVRERAAQLWRRERGEQAWSSLIAELRAATTIALNESQFLPLDPAAVGTAAANEAGSHRQVTSR